MKRNPQHCIRCHPPAPGDIPPSGQALLICDLCMQQLNHPRAVRLPVVLQHPPTEPDVRKSKQRKGRRKKAVATALALLLLPLAGCTLHRDCTLDVTLDPSLLRLPQPPTADPPGGPPPPDPTES